MITNQDITELFDSVKHIREKHTRFKEVLKAIESTYDRNLPESWKNLTEKAKLGRIAYFWKKSKK